MIVLIFLICLAFIVVPIVMDMRRTKEACKKREEVISERIRREKVLENYRISAEKIELKSL